MDSRVYGNDILLHVYILFWPKNGLASQEFRMNQSDSD